MIKLLLIIILLANFSFAASQGNLESVSKYIDHGAYSLAEDVINNLDIAQMTSAQKREYYYYSGIILFYKKDYESAEKSFYSAISFPSTTLKDEIYLQLSKISYVNKDYGSIIKYIEMISDESGLQHSEELVFLKAVSYKGMGDYENAINMYQRLITENVSEKIKYSSIKGVAEIYFFKKDYLSAASFFAQLKNSTERSLSQKGYYYEARCYFESANYSKAEKILKQYLNSFSQFDYLMASYEMLAEIYFNAKKYNSALSFYNELRKDSYYKEIALYGQGLCFYHLKSYKNAIDALGQYVRESKDLLRRDRAYYYLAYMTREIKNYQASIDYLNILIKSPEIDETMKSLSVLMKLSDLYSLKQYEKAVAFFKLNNGNLIIAHLEKGYLNAGKAAYYAHDYSSSVSWLNNLRYDKMDLETIFCLSDSYFKTSQYAQAEKYFTEVLKKDDESVYREYVLYAIARSYYEKKQYDWAIAYCDAFLKEYSGGYADDCLWVKAESLFTMKEYKDAYVAYGNFAEKTDNTRYKVKAYYLKGYMDFYNDKFDKAVVNFNNAIKVASDKDEFFFKSLIGMGNAFYQKGDWQRAVSAYKTILEEDMADSSVLAEAYVRIADAYRSSKDYSSALKWYSKGVELFAQSKWAPVYLMGKIICLKKMSKDYSKEFVIFKAKYSKTLYIEPLLKELEK